MGTGTKSPVPAVQVDLDNDHYFVCYHPPDVGLDMEGVSCPGTHAAGSVALCAKHGLRCPGSRKLLRSGSRALRRSSQCGQLGGRTCDTGCSGRVLGHDLEPCGTAVCRATSPTTGWVSRRSSPMARARSQETTHTRPSVRCAVIPAPPPNGPFLASRTTLRVWNSFVPGITNRRSDAS